jgi:hypothetical protein
MCRSIVSLQEQLERKEIEIDTVQEQLERHEEMETRANDHPANICTDVKLFDSHACCRWNGQNII